MANSTTMSTVAQWCAAGCILLRDTMYVVVCSAVCSSMYTTTRQCSVGISVVMYTTTSSMYVVVSMLVLLTVYMLLDVVHQVSV